MTFRYNGKTFRWKINSSWDNDLEIRLEMRRFGVWLLEFKRFIASYELVNYRFKSEEEILSLVIATKAELWEQYLEYEDVGRTIQKVINSNK